MRRRALLVAFGGLCHEHLHLSVYGDEHWHIAEQCRSQARGGGGLPGATPVQTFLAGVAALDSFGHLCRLSDGSG